MALDRIQDDSPPPHTHTHWTSFQMATPALQETVKRHVFWPTPSQSPLSCCHRLPPLFQTWEFCVHHFQGTHCQALQVASFTSLSLRGSPQKPTSPLPAPPHPPPWVGHWGLTAQQQVSPRNNPTYESFSQLRSLLLSFICLRGPSVMEPVYRCFLRNLGWMIRNLIRISYT